MRGLNKKEKMELSLEDRLKKVEALVKHLKNRMVSRVGVVVPPFPISFFGDHIQGELFRYQFPVSGHVSDFHFHADEWPEDVDEVSGELRLDDPNGQIFLFKVEQTKRGFLSGFNVEAGTRMILTLDASITLKGVWLSFLFDTDLRRARLQTELIENLEAMNASLTSDAEN